MRNRSISDAAREPGRTGLRSLGVAVVVLSAAGLAGCGSITAETGTSAYIAPGRFNIYTCEDIDNRQQQVERRKNELEQLMGRASEGAGGSVVNAIAYRAEYTQSRDELKELSKASADKQCSAQSPWSSKRALF